MGFSKLVRFHLSIEPGPWHRYFCNDNISLIYWDLNKNDDILQTAVLYIKFALFDLNVTVSTFVREYRNYNNQYCIGQRPGSEYDTWPSIGQIRNEPVHWQTYVTRHQCINSSERLFNSTCTCSKSTTNIWFEGSAYVSFAFSKITRDGIDITIAQSVQ